MARNNTSSNNGNQRGRNNNNAEGKNQYSGGWMDTAKDRPVATAAAAAAAVGAGVFLWSRRNQISDQISSLSDQITDWSQNMMSGSRNENEQFEMAGADYESTGMASSNRTASGIGASKNTRPTKSARGGSSNRSPRGSNAQTTTTGSTGTTVGNTGI